MELKTYFAQDAAGNIISSAIVNVFLQGTTTLATGLTRADGTPLENPFAADGAGRIQFRAPDGYYDVQVSAGPGIIQTLTIQCVDYSGAKADADRAETARDGAEQALADFEGQASGLLPKADLAANDGEKLIGLCPTIATLRTIEPQENGQRITLREHTAGTGKGGGQFRAVMDGSGYTDNNGTTVKTTGGAAWLRINADVVNPLMFGAKANWNPATQSGDDDSLAFQGAANASRSVYVPAGSYLAMNIDLLSNTVIYGDGAASSIYQRENIDANVAILGTNFNNGGSADWSYNTKNVVIKNLRLVRTNRTTYVSSSDIWQQYHLIYLSAVTGAKVINCILEGFNGDAIYIGGGYGSDIERHNFDIEIAGNIFNGIDNQNRNGISIIDCEGLNIHHNTFLNVSNRYQPGAIDVEPNTNTFHRVLNFNIVFNTFVECGGDAGSASLIIQIPDVAYTTMPTGFLFAFNQVDGVTSNSIGVVVTHNGDATTLRNHNIQIIGNKIRRVNRPFSIMGASNVLMAQNQYDGSTLGAVLGFSGGGRKNYNIRINENYFKDIGKSEGRGIGIYVIDGLEITKNRFVNVGKSDGTLGQALLFNVGSSSNVKHKDNVYENRGNTTVPVAVSGHTFNPASTVNLDNVYINCSGNLMIAEQNDEGEQVYTPIIYGNTSGGTGTYTRQVGRWTRRGKWVTFRAEIETTAHDGSGIVTVSLPTLSDTVGSQTTLLNARASGTGVSSQGSANGILRAVVNNGVAGVRLQSATADSYVQFAPGGAMTVYLSGTYKMP